jgi:uncharacterized protein YcbX
MSSPVDPLAPRVTSIHVYPIKSCRAIDLKSTRLDELGLLYDRRLMVIDAETSRFLTQRDEPRMTLITPRLAPTALQVSAPEMPPLKVDMNRDDMPRREITVWNFTGPAEDMGENAASWISTVLQRSCRLVRFPEDVQREVSPKRVGPGVLTAFTDGYPILITNEGSLEDLNGRASERVSMSRFRPNIVIGGAAAYAEDTWKRIRVGEIEIDVVKPCSRCAITTVDIATGKRGKEPLATLAQHRRYEKETWFGQNAVHRSLGSIRIGDSVEILETGPASPPIAKNDAS